MAVVGFVIRPPVFKTPEGDLPAFSYIFVRERVGPRDRRESPVITVNIVLTELTIELTLHQDKRRQVTQWVWRRLCESERQCAVVIARNASDVFIEHAIYSRVLNVRRQQKIEREENILDRKRPAITPASIRIQSQVDRSAVLRVDCPRPRQPRHIGVLPGVAHQEINHVGVPQRAAQRAVGIRPENAQCLLHAVDPQSQLTTAPGPGVANRREALAILPRQIRRQLINTAEGKPFRIIAKVGFYLRRIVIKPRFRHFLGAATTRQSEKQARHENARRHEFHFQLIAQACE